jgi:replication factor C large subunit
MVDWTEKHRPETLDEVRGHDSDVAEVREWAETWDEHREPLVLHGPPGIGKTTVAHALANDMGWDVVEMNASDSRTADAVDAVGGRAASNRSLTDAASGGDDGRQLLLLDEADNLSHQGDRGGAAAMTDLVKATEQPAILTANEYYEMSRGLRSATRDIEFSMSARSIRPALRHICRQEGVEFDEAVLEDIAARNEDDLRGAVKDLQSRVVDGRVGAEGGEGERDKTVGIFPFLDAVLKEQSAEEALYTAYDVDETPDDLLLWVEDKVPKVYEGAELAAAYEFLANADRWLGRVRATQDYSYWRYATDNVAAGVAAARREDRGGWTRYGGAPYRSSRDAVRDHVAEQVAAAHGVSVATARREVVPFLAAMTHHCKNRELTVRMAAAYDMDAEHVAFVTGSGESTNKVQDIVAEAKELRGAVVEESEGYFDDADGDVGTADDAGGGTADDDGEEAADDATADDDAGADDGDDDQMGLGDFA